MQSFRSSIQRKQRNDWWQEIRKYCHQLIEECNKHGHPPTHRFVHPQTIIDTFIELGLRPPNNLRGLNKFCDNFISKLPIATPRHVQNKLRSEYLVFGYCRLFSQLFNVHIPLDVSTICFQWYFYTTNHISVFVRFKPRKTVSNGFVVVNILKNNKDVQITHPNTSINLKPFTFNSLDYIFDWNCNEKQVFNITTKNLIYSLFEGYNATVICYDNGKCGKIFSTQRNKGYIPRAIKLIYELIKLKTNTSKYIEYSITMSYLRLYSEQITDLLNVNNTGLTIRYKYNTIKGMCIDNITTQKCENEKICKKWIKFGDENMNICGNKNCNCSPSSFSKATYVLIMNLHQIDIKNLNQKISKLMFVDLECSGEWCGCRYTPIPCRGYYNNERKFGSTINSLSTLRSVVSQLSAQKRHISYKDSVLTKLLMDSLGGNCKISLIINCS
eukprot:164691_1